MQFTKWHGIGNDFLIITESELDRSSVDSNRWIDRDEADRPVIRKEAAVAVLDRHFGVGGDGILVLGDSKIADARMLIHNADGSMAEMCGNGIRVAARFLAERSLVSLQADGSFSIETAGGIMRPTLLDDGRVRVDMGPVESEGIAELTLSSASLDHGSISVSGRVVSVGNPHFVVNLPPEGPDLHRLGPLIEHDSRFPQRTNVEFWNVVDFEQRVLQMRVWERGVGETLACGTGACAVAYTAQCDLGLDGIITVKLPGGSLEIEMVDGRAHMIGAAHFGWSGEMDLDQIMMGLGRTLQTS